MIKENINVVKNNLSDLVNECNNLVTILDKYQMLSSFTELTTQQNADVLNLVTTKAANLAAKYNEIVTSFQATKVINKD